MDPRHPRGHALPRQWMSKGSSEMRLHTQADTEDRRTVTCSVPAGLTQQCTEVEGGCVGFWNAPIASAIKTACRKGGRDAELIDCDQV